MGADAIQPGVAFDAHALLSNEFFVSLALDDGDTGVAVGIVLGITVHTEASLSVRV